MNSNTRLKYSPKFAILCKAVPSVPPVKSGLRGSRYSDPCSAFCRNSYHDVQLKHLGVVSKIRRVQNGSEEPGKDEHGRARHMIGYKQGHRNSQTIFVLTERKLVGYVEFQGNLKQIQ